MSTKMFADIKPTTTPSQTQPQSQQNRQQPPAQPQKKSTSMFAMFNVAPKVSKEPPIQAELLLITQTKASLVV